MINLYEGLELCN